MDNGAWDYPANTRGYTYGVALEFNTTFWELHYGIFAEPAPGQRTGFRPTHSRRQWSGFGAVENYNLDGCPGKLREFVYLNHAHMGNYALALQEMPLDPDVTLTRAYRVKYGFGMNWQQEVIKTSGCSPGWAGTKAMRRRGLSRRSTGRRYSVSFGMADCGIGRRIPSAWLA